MSNFQGDHKAESVEQSAQPTLCANGCGFFANPSTNNMCSKCYRDSQLNAERKASNSKAAISALTDVPNFPEVPEVLGAKAAQPQAKPLQPVLTQQTERRASQDVQDQPLKEPSSETAVKNEPNSADSDAALFERPAQKPGRCFTCNKKVGLTGFKCRCEYVFCGAHRLAEQHDCEYDYKRAGRQHLAESNPLIQASKMDRL